MNSCIITISGASAAGKSFYVDEVTKKFPNVIETLGLTTRSIRPGEINGKSGIFITDEEMNKLEQEGKLILVKEFFGKKYAWYKDDLVNNNTYRIINISHKSIKELKDMGLNIYSVFIKPESDQVLIDILKKRALAKEEFEKRLRGYYESKEFIKNNYELFDLVFTNDYKRETLEDFLSHIEKFVINKKDDNVKRLILKPKEY